MGMGFQAMLSPLVLAAAAIILTLQISYKRQSTIAWWISIIGLLLSILALFSMTEMLSVEQHALQVTPLLVTDQFSIFFTLLILLATLVTVLLGKDYLRDRSGENEEFYLLLLLSALGAVILVSATHLASFLLGLELLGVALYALIAYPERGHLPLEAAVKYLVLSGAASAILLFGFALLYAALGTLSFAELGAKLSQSLNGDQQLIVLMGTAMIFAGVGFKLSLVPFHMWTPDVYQGAPSPITGFLATVSKGAIFAALLRLFIDAKLYQYQGLMSGLSLVAIASMLGGNLLALRQDNLKRLLAYSSIAHIGYLIITLVVYGAIQQSDLAVEAASFYLTAYIITSLAAFSLLSIVSNKAETDTINDIQGLFWRSPMLAILLTLALLSLAGIPLTVGFIGKFYIFTAGIKGELWLLLAALVIGSGIGIYYYLRIIFSMTMPLSGDSQAIQLPHGGLSLTAKFVVCLLIFMMLYLGVLPQTMMAHLGTMSL